MTAYYESITNSATDAIEAMAHEQHSTAVCPAAEVQSLAAYVFFSWLSCAGRSAKREDAEKMMGLIVGML